MLVPGAIPDTMPPELIVAAPVLDEVHGVVVFAVGEPVKVVVVPAQSCNVPVIVGKALIVTIAV